MADYTIAFCTITGPEAAVVAFARRHPGSGGFEWKLRKREAGIMIFEIMGADGFPEPVFRRLAEMHPDLVFGIVVYDECWEFACSAEGDNGKNDFHEVDPRPELRARAAAWADTRLRLAFTGGSSRGNRNLC